jgi:hypothetical protein
MMRKNQNRRRKQTLPVPTFGEISVSAKMPENIAPEGEAEVEGVVDSGPNDLFIPFCKMAAAHLSSASISRVLQMSSARPIRGANPMGDANSNRIANGVDDDLPKISAHGISSNRGSSRGRWMSNVQLIINTRQISNVRIPNVSNVRALGDLVLWKLLRRRQ